MERYTLSLALFDYLPVLAGGIAIFLICKYCAMVAQRSGVWLLIIPALALTGGLLKASWKTLYVVTGQNIQWMSDQLFFFIASSYVLLAALVLCSLRAHTRQQTLNANWWKLPSAVVLLVVGAALYLKFSFAARYWSALLLATMSICNLVFIVRLILHAKSLSRWLSVGGFLIGLVLSYVLVGLARIEEQTLELQWTEEVLNLLAQSATGLAAWYLYQRHVARQPAEQISEI